MERRSILPFLTGFALIATAAPIPAQTPVVMGAGYNRPTQLNAAPGQVVTIFVSGAKTRLPEPALLRASTDPLPTTLGGFSVQIRQGEAYSLPTTWPARLISIFQTAYCGSNIVFGTGLGLTPDCFVTALTVQIPNEIHPLPAGPKPSSAFADLSVTDNGSETGKVIFAALSDNIHVLTDCDGLPQSPGQHCRAMVTHPDGTLVTPDSPAKPSETVVVYAYGLGRTIPAVRTGEAAPVPAPVLANAVSLQFDFRPNARPSPPYVNPSADPSGGPRPEFAGLSPGAVGLYQINVKLPGTFPALDECTPESAVRFSANPAGAVLSNLTIDIGGVVSFDGAPICVQKPHSD
jgi:uncharacterized protein (TIGR03437 family)